VIRTRYRDFKTIKTTESVNQKEAMKLPGSWVTVEMITGGPL
jgi:hypothetical protein